MLDDRAAGLALERIGRKQGTLEIEKVVEGELLTALLNQASEAGYAVILIKSSALAGILAVSEILSSVERKNSSVRKLFGALACEPFRNGSVIGSRVRKNFFGEEAP